MKYLWSFLLVCSVEAATLSQYYSSPDGSSIQKFTVTPKKSVYEKNSNFFDHEKMYTLGFFSLKNSTISPEDFKKLDEILGKIQAIDKFMKRKDSSFNDLSDKTPHKSFLVLNDYRVSQGSDLYPELKMLFEKFQKLNWVQDSGIKLSDDFKTVTTFKGGKAVKSEPFNFKFLCQKTEAPSICAYKDLGILYIQ